MNDSTSQRDIATALSRAKKGDPAALGQVLESFHPQIKLLAKMEIGRNLQGKVGASDVVQDVFLQASRQFANFQGVDLPQFNRWLRTILAGTLANTMRHYFGTQARNLHLERDVNQRLDESACQLGSMLVAGQSSPSQHVMADEQSRLVATAMNRLAPDYQTVIELRHLDGLTFPQIAEKMGRSVDSVEKLWLRGITKLRQEFAESNP